MSRETNMKQTASPATEPKNRHWTTLGELHGDEAALAVKNSEFYSKPEEFFNQEQATKFSVTGDPTLISEAAGFMELKVKQNGGESGGMSRRDFLKISGSGDGLCNGRLRLASGAKDYPLHQSA
ncbi:MAG: TAT-variant-translocated molybdopterin oxidoreductase [bacterium]|nr:TAT-variant-translocated molybdopterin oxidoreductase [bacterium]